MAASHAARPWLTPPRPPTSCSAPNSPSRSSVPVAHARWNAWPGQPADDVALGVPAALVLQHEVAAVAAEVDGEAVGERQGRPREAGHGVGLLGQPRHARELAGPVLLAALGHEGPRVLVRHDHVGVERARAQHADGVVVTEHEVAHRLVGVLAQAGQPLRGSDGGGQRLEADEEVLALDRADVGVTLGGEGVDPVGEHLEGLFLRGQVTGRRERLRCHDALLIIKALTTLQTTPAGPGRGRAAAGRWPGHRAGA
jgi:hypothetical protein